MLKKHSLQQAVIIGLFLQLVCIKTNANHHYADTAITIRNDIAYKKSLTGGTQTEFLLDIYQPPSSNTRIHPVIIFVHGGGFWEGDKRSALYVQMASAFARKGYMGVSVNYRLKKQNAPFNSAVLDTCIADVTTAINWIKANRQLLQADTSNLFICGDSAGGGIIINTAYSVSNRSRFRGCIDLWGGLPGSQGWEAPIYSKSFHNRMPPTCIIHGTADHIVPYATSSQLAARLTAAGVLHELHALPGADHYPVDRATEYIPVMLAFTGKLLQKKK